ncbi:MAG: N-acyl homoserine lactonase family protein [Candidatus Bathyarchaeia archaeon]
MGLRIRPLLCGTIRGNKALVNTLGKDVDKWVDNPSIVWYIEGAKERILVDTGMADEERANKYHYPGSRRTPDQEPQNALRRIGVRAEDIDMVIYTHLHWDHCHNADKFKNATFIVHRDELSFAIAPIPPYYRSYEALAIGLKPPFLEIPFETIAKEREVARGVTVFPTPGHSPGHQSVAVETDKGVYVITGDAVFVYENWEGDPERKMRFWPIGRYYDIGKVWESFERIAEIADFILPGHEMRVFDKEVYP